MTYHIDRVAQLENALARDRFGSVASLRAAGVPFRQHNVKVTKAAKKTAAKKTTKKASAKPVKKATAKKTTSTAAKKTAAKK